MNNPSPPDQVLQRRGPLALMRLAATCLLLPLLAAAAERPEPAARCAAEGEPVQWVVDYCMLKMETDDEIAVSGCVEAEQKRPFADGCASNLHFKRGMCEIMVRYGTRAGTVDHCVNDPAFKGWVVEAGGVGGR